MRRAGRPTTDPKEERVTLRLTARDVAALRSVAERHDESLSAAARRALRGALKVPATPPRKKKP